MMAGTTESLHLDSQIGDRERDTENDSVFRNLKAPPPSGILASTSPHLLNPPKQFQL